MEIRLDRVYSHFKPGLLKNERLSWASSVSRMTTPPITTRKRPGKPNVQPSVPPTQPPLPPSGPEAIRKRSIWQSFAVLPARTRLKVSLAVTAVALAGIYASDQLEALLPPSPEQKPKPSSSS